MKNYTLVAVMGKTPQILSETLYCLWVKQKRHISKIKVITTSNGAELLKECYFPLESKVLGRFSKDYDFDLSRLNFSESDIIYLHRDNGAVLDDIRTSEDTGISQQIIIQTIRDLSMDEDQVLLASVAGGRKTMGVNLAYAMQLFGRESDKMYHVLVHEKLETDKNFFYPEPNRDYGIPRGTEIIELAELPFIKLRRNLQPFLKWNLHSEDWIQIADCICQERTMPEKVHLKRSEKAIIVNDTEWIKLEPQQFTLYYIFALQKLKHCSRPERKLCGDCHECYLGLYEKPLDEQSYLDIYRDFARYGNWEKLKTIIEKSRKKSIKKDGMYSPFNFDEFFNQNLSKLNRNISKKNITYFPFLEVKSISGYRKKYGLLLDKGLLEIT